MTGQAAAEGGSARSKLSRLAATNAQAGVHEIAPIEIPMRDGATLAADLLEPPGNGPWPVVLIQTPYGREIFHSTIENDRPGDPLFEHPSYAFVVMDQRGFFDSVDAGGYGTPTFAQDGYDAVEWIAAQPWSNGKVGTWGPSALGTIQLKTAQEHPPHLAAAAPIVYHYGESYRHTFPGGVYARNQGQSSGVGVLLKGNTLYNDTWDLLERTSARVGQIDVPMLHVGGWYDHWTEAIFEQVDEIDADIETNSGYGH